MAILADQNTRVIVQGITGREAAACTRDMLAYGTRVVAGITPGKGGGEVHGVPVYDTVRQALRHHEAEAAVISVPPAAVRDAVLEALANGIRLLVVVTERIPRRDVIEFLEAGREIGANIIGPNSLGLISPGRIKLGMAGGPAPDARKAYLPGAVGIASRSGGMTTEIANLLTTHGIGQSTCVSIGGDPVVGMSFLEVVPLFDRDPETKAVVLFCEPGGAAEEALAFRLARERMRVPIIAFVAGRFADRIPGTRFGHAAVVVEGERGSTHGKIEALRNAGVQVADCLSDIVPLVRRHLEPKGE